MKQTKVFTIYDIPPRKKPNRIIFFTEFYSAVQRTNIPNNYIVILCLNVCVHYNGNPLGYVRPADIEKEACCIFIIIGYGSCGQSVTLKTFRPHSA